jgi:hypothetical protein
MCLRIRRKKYPVVRGTDPQHWSAAVFLIRTELVYLRSRIQESQVNTNPCRNNDQQAISHPFLACSSFLLYLYF